MCRLHLAAHLAGVIREERGCLALDPWLDLLVLGPPPRFCRRLTSVLDDIKTS